MYELIIVLHSLLRWLVVLNGLVATALAFSGWFGSRPWTRSDQRWGLLFTVALDLQVLLGLLLFLFFSPITTGAFANMGGAMSNAVVRFWTVEHSTLGILALALAHIGRARSKRGLSAVAQHRNAAIFFALSVLLILLATPWPFSRVARPWFPQ